MISKKIGFMQGRMTMPPSKNIIGRFFVVFFPNQSREIFDISQIL